MFPRLYGKCNRPLQARFPDSKARKMTSPPPSARLHGFAAFSHTQCISHFARLADILRAKFPANSRNLGASTYILCISLTIITKRDGNCKTFPAISAHLGSKTFTKFRFAFCSSCTIQTVSVTFQTVQPCAGIGSVTSTVPCCVLPLCSSAAAISVSSSSSAPMLTPGASASLRLNAPA